MFYHVESPAYILEMFFPLDLLGVKLLQIFFSASLTSAVPNPLAADLYRSMGHLVPGRTERINNLHYFVLFII